VDDETCRPIYCPPSAIVHLVSQTELDRISAQSGDRSSVGRISDGIMHVFRTFRGHAGILNNVASYLTQLLFDADASGIAVRAMSDIAGT